MNARIRSRIISLMLCAVMFISLMPMNVSAAETVHVHDYTAGYQYDGEKAHYGVCSCGAVDSENPINCTYEEGVPGWYRSPNENREGLRDWECTVCHGEWRETVPAHKCSEGDVWVNYDYRYHSTSCTFPGCGAWMGQRHEDYMTGIFHEDADTVRNECTKCDYFTSYDIEATFTVVDAKEATCAAPGNTKFYICSHCDKYFSDENCQHEVTPADVYINPLEHNYVNGACSVCGYKIKQARFVQSPDDTFASDDGYLYVLIGVGSNGKLYAMGEATGDGRRYGMEIPDAQIDENGVVTLTPEQAEFMDFEYYFENGSMATTTSTFMVDGNYMTARYGKIYTFPQDRLDDKNNPRPFDFRQANYGDESGLGSVSCDLYNPKTYEHKFEYITFNAETHCFEVSAERQNTIYLYRQLCDHEDIHVTRSYPIAPTCTEQGYGGDYWFCSMCFKYFSDAECTTEYVFPDNVYNVEEYFNRKALGHKFAANGVCENCGMKRNVYKQVTSLEQFDQLSENAYYIIVFKDGEKTYAAYVPNRNYPCDTDEDGNGVVDLLEPDTNTNGIPDCIEEFIDNYWGADENEDGMTTVEEYNNCIGDCTEDGNIDMEDYKIFYTDYVYWDLYYRYEEEAFGAPNFVEVTVASDGSITVIDEGAMEFQMRASGVWGGQPNEDWMLDEYGVKETDRLRAAWVPNWWVANSGMMGLYGEEHFMMQERYFGDGDYPGIIDNKNWKISFNEDGTVNFVCGWTEFDDAAALQLVRYKDADGNERMTIVGCYSSQWEYSDIMTNIVVKFPAYLYASEPVYNIPPHECVWGPWSDDDVTDTHTRRCTVEDCDKKQTEKHNWDDGIQTSEPNCTETGEIIYNCPDCEATKTDVIPELGHDWGPWEYDSVDSHVRDCKRNCGVDQDFGGHEWEEWKPVDDNMHKMTCSICEGEQTEEHDWDEGVVTKEPTEWEEGITTYTCITCSHTKTAPIDKLVHECVWSDWYPNGDENHKRDCLDDHCEAFETLPHEWDEGEITTEPTCKETGIKTFTCQTCMHTRTEDIPIIGHEYGEWTPNNDGETHSRFCRCNESETEDHEFDNGEVTQAPTHEAVGEIRFTCGDCGYSYTEDIPALTEHQWGEWVVNKVDEMNTHIRFCICNESETAPHNFSEWEEQDNGEYKRLCADCGYYEIIALDEDQSVNTTTNDNAANTNIANTDIELIDKVLTDEEQSLVASGAEVQIYLQVQDISNAAPAAHKAEIEEVAGSDVIGMYLDMQLFKQVGDESETSVTETDGAITITITIPDDLINTDPSVTRIYRIIRVHEDNDGNLITDVIEGIFDPENNSFTFETDKFSTYALTYWPPSECVVTFDAGGGMVDQENAAVIYQTAYGTLPTPVYEGCTFLGWYTDEGVLVTEESKVEKASDHTLYARWDYKYTVSAPETNIPDGSEVEKGTRLSFVSAINGASIYYTTDPEIGESVSAENGILYEDVIFLTEDVIIYAVAVKDGYKPSEVQRFAYTVKDDSQDWGDISEEDRTERGFETAYDVPEGLWIAGVSDREYTGKVHTFADLHIYNYKTLLQEKIDYTIKYTNNTNAGTATITVTGKGNYAGTIVETFTILPLDLSEASVADVKVPYTGKVQKVASAVTFLLDGKEIALKSGKDYTVAYPGTDSKAPDYNSDAFKQIGSYEVVLTGKGNYTGTTTYAQVIDGKYAMSKMSVSKIPDQKYTGEAFMPSLVIKNGKTELVEGVDYVAEYTDNIQVGTATVTITGMGEYAGVKTVTFKITGTALSKVKMSGFVASMPWTGEAIVQDVSFIYTTGSGANKVTLELEEGVDYTVTYTNNTEVGTATVVYTGMGGYTGTIKKTYKIIGLAMSKAVVSGLEKSVDFVPGEIKQDAYALTYAVKVNGVTENVPLIEGTDYEVSYKNNTKAGSASMVFTGIGGYTGSLTKSFTIKPMDMVKAEGKIVVSEIGEQAYRKGGVMPQPVVKYVDGETEVVLESGKDYTLKYTNNKTVADKTAKKAPLVTITGKGSYKGALKQNFTIVASDLSVVTISAKNVVYQNKAGICKPTITLKDVDGKTLSAGTDYDKTITYTYAKDVRVSRMVNKKSVFMLREQGEEVDKLDIIPVGAEIIATVNGKNLYGGSTSVRFRFIASDISKATVKVAAQEYTGKAVEPTKDDLTVTIGKTVLAKTDYVIVGYENNVKKGTAKVTIRGIGNYGGEKTVTFQIASKNMNYTIIFDKNAFTATGTMKNATLPAGKALTANAYKRSGYVFAGWNTKADGSGISYTDKETFYLKGQKVYGTRVRLYAQWVEK